MFTELQRLLKERIERIEEVRSNSVFVWTNEDGDLNALIEEQLTAVQAMAVLIAHPLPETVSNVPGVLLIEDLDVSIRVVEKITLQPEDATFHALELAELLLRHLHGYNLSAAQVPGVTGMLMCKPGSFPLKDIFANLGETALELSFTTAGQLNLLDG